MIFVAALAVFSLAAQAAMIPIYLKAVTAWSATFASLWAVALGWAAARILDRSKGPAAIRAGVAALLLVVFALSPVRAHHAAMPSPPPPRPTLTLIEEDAAPIRAVVPKGSRVFLLGSPIPAYLAEVSPYLRQIFGVWTFVPSTDDFTVVRSGLWGPHQAERWLGRDTPFALIKNGRLNHFETIPCYRPVIGQIGELLDRHFDRVGRGGLSGFTPAFDIHARKPPMRAQAPGAGATR